MPPIVPRLTWKTFLALWILGSLSVLAVFPSVAAVAQSRLTVPIPPWVFFAGQYLQIVLLLGLAVWLGWRLAPAAGLGAPLFEDWFRGRPVSSRLKSSLLWPALWGLLAGAVLSGLDLLVFARAPFPGMFEHLSAVFYSGIGEELWLRWFLLTVILWLLVKLARIPPSWAAWLAIVLVSLAFSLIQWQRAAAGADFGLMGLTRFVLLNGVSGLLYGWCYWRRGVEAAMACHWAAGAASHVILAG